MDGKEYCDGCFLYETKVGTLKQLENSGFQGEPVNPMYCKSCFAREMIFRKIYNANRPDNQLPILSFRSKK